MPQTARDTRVQARIRTGTRTEIQKMAESERRTEADMLRVLIEEALQARAATARRR